jgi:GalNAc-alpha-(1->4)-GalNAc-alpha-(1->3)-diNAcBac-PP-undecaprenol alpha-1,4-N-acetyl-D-galactosaminyltransferase
MSAGLPVVAYDCVAGPSEMINDGENGFLVPLFDKETFRKKLQYLVDNESRRIEMGRSGRKSIARYSNDVIAEEFFQFITSHIN